MKTMIAAVMFSVLVGVSGCAAPSPGDRAKHAQRDYADCLEREIPKSAKTDATAEAAADAAISACASYRTTLYQEVRTANQNDIETTDSLKAYDEKVRAQAIDYVNRLRKK